MSGAQSLEVIRNFESGNDIRQIVSCSEGGRALRLLKRREETKARAEAAKAEIENETKKRKFSSLDQKYGSNAQADALEEEFKKQTVGLVSKEEYGAKRKAIDEIIENQKSQGKDTKLRLKRAVKTKQLSFQDDPDKLMSLAPTLVKTTSTTTKRKTRKAKENSKGLLERTPLATRHSCTMRTAKPRWKGRNNS